MKGTVIGIHPSPENKTPPISENDGAEVKRYIHACGSHGEHIDMLDLITGKWLTLDTWRKLAKEKLGFDEAKFEEYRGDLERTYCIVASATGDDLHRVVGVPLTENPDDEQPTELPKDFPGLVSAMKQEIPAPPEWTRDDDDDDVREIDADRSRPVIIED
jgi:hypothetical protein